MTVKTFRPGNKVIIAGHTEATVSSLPKRVMRGGRWTKEVAVQITSGHYRGSVKRYDVSVVEMA
jgi:hypothetical protein